MNVPVIDHLERARATEPTFRVREGVYIIGSLEKGVTVYNQQLRSHNLIWALWEIAQKDKADVGRIAVVGGGVAGLTAAACAAVLFEKSNVTLFERRSDLCPLQQGSDNRWLHPRIYDWPREGSRATTAALPILNWSEGRASDVARQVISQFGKYADWAGNRLQIYVGVNHLRITCATRQIEWIGTNAALKGSFVNLAKSEGKTSQFDLIILAGGFGLEAGQGPFGTTSYWRNEQVGQPVLNGSRQSYLISGYGDGALVDLCRLAIMRFRQDTVLYELFGNTTIEDKESEIRTIKQHEEAQGTTMFDLLAYLVDTNLEHQKNLLSERVRTDTKVIMHLAGRNNNKSILQIFGGRVSFLNQFLLFLLYRCGAFSASFDTLENAVREHNVSSTNVLCRYGTDVLPHLLAFFTEGNTLQPTLEQMAANQLQRASRLWAPGCFRSF